MGAVALIPARGGSKRLPGKNIRPFGGCPLLVYSIRVARDTVGVDRCVVSTDDAAIAAVATAYGAEVIERPAALAGDTASTASVAVHALETMVAQGRVPDTVLLLQPNCPLRPRGLGQLALSQIDAGDADSVVSVSPHHLKTGTVDGGRFVPDYVPGTRSQDLRPRVFENGVIYATRSRVILDQHSVFGRAISPLIIDPIYALGDIDTELDWQVAEHLFRTHPELFGWLSVDGADSPRPGPTAGALHR